MEERTLLLNATVQKSYILAAGLVKVIGTPIFTK